MRMRKKKRNINFMRQVIYGLPACYMYSDFISGISIFANFPVLTKIIESKKSEFIEIIRVERFYLI